MTRIKCRFVQPALLLLAMFVIAAGPQAVQAANTCNGQLSIDYAEDDPNFAQVGDVYHVTITLGTASITGGTFMTLNRFKFELDCDSVAVPCPDDGNAPEVGYEGDATITSDCGVTWTTSHPVGGAPNEVTFTPDIPLDIPANNGNFCTVSFNVKVLSLAGTEILQAAGFLQEDDDAQCDNGLSSGSQQAGSIPECPTCVDENLCNEEVCNQVTGQCDVTHTTTDAECADENLCTGEVCDTTTGQCATTSTTTDDDCADENLCTAEECIEATGQCATTSTTTDDDCADENLCTAEECIEATGQCASTSTTTDTDCADANLCTREECIEATGQCATTSTTTDASCADANLCNAEACNPATGQCAVTSTTTDASCADADPCTTESCNPANGQCQSSQPIPGCGGFCEKAAVQAVLHPVTGRFPGNQGPDVVVRLDLNQPVQDAIDTATDTNGDGYIIIGVTKDATGTLGGHRTESIVIDRNFDKTNALIGCSVTLHDENTNDDEPTALITANASSPGNIFVMDVHGADSEVAGWLVEGNGRYLRNVEANDNEVGVWFDGNGNTMHNGATEGNSDVGILVDGNNNVIDGADSFSNGSWGIEVNGDGNTLTGNDVGEIGKGNGAGISIAGNSNVLNQNDAFANTGNGIQVVGNSNVLKKNVAGARGKGNRGDGISVNGTGNGITTPIELEENTARSNGTLGNGNVGIRIVGTGHQLKKNISGGSGTGETNIGYEYNVAAGNFNAKDNKSNGTTVTPNTLNAAFPTGPIGSP